MLKKRIPKESIKRKRGPPAFLLPWSELTCVHLIFPEEWVWELIYTLAHELLVYAKHVI